MNRTYDAVHLHDLERINPDELQDRLRTQPFATIRVARLIV